MIDLTYSKRQMLADIGAASIDLDDSLRDPSDPRFLSEQTAVLVLQGPTRDAVAEPMKEALNLRFAHIPAKRRRDELVYLVKKATGNAFNWGHLHDESKTILVEMVVTPKGAVVTVADEGVGFDAAATLQKFQQGGDYFNNHGTGFVRFVKTPSLITYSNGGRSFHIRFLCEEEPGQKLTPQDKLDFGEAADASYMQRFLAEALPAFDVAACRIYRPHKVIGARRYLLYQLDGTDGESWLLTGEMLTGEGVQTAVSVTRQLDIEGIFAQTGIHILRPVTYLSNPPIAFYPFNPQRNFGKIVGKQKDFTNDTLPLMRQLGEALARFHQSQITLSRFVEAESQIEQVVSILEQAKAALAEHTPERVDVVEQFVTQFNQQVNALRDATPVPIHGNLSWNDILYSRKQLHLHGFEASHYSHPGFDLGGFLADLTRHYLDPEERDEARQEAAEAAFLQAYFSDEKPSWAADLSFFRAAALILRLGRLLMRPHKKWEPKVDTLLDQIRAALSVPELA